MSGPEAVSHKHTWCTENNDKGREQPFCHSCITSSQTAPCVNYIHSLYEITAASYKWCMKIKWENSNQGMNPWPHGWAGLGEGGRGADKAAADRKPCTCGKPKQPPQHSAFKSRRWLKQHQFKRLKCPRNRGRIRLYHPWSHKITLELHPGRTDFKERYFQWLKVHLVIWKPQRSHAETKGVDRTRGLSCRTQPGPCSAPDTAWWSLKVHWLSLCPTTPPAPSLGQPQAFLLQCRT